MKSRFVSLSLIFLFLTIFSYSQSTPPSADEIMKEAYQQATKENKNVFVIFHASWCVWCHRMDSSMNDASCKKYFSDNFVIRHMTVDESKDKKNLENPGANEFRNKYGGADLGIPYWLIFDHNGKLLADSRIRTDGNVNSTPGENIGCPAKENEVAYFIKVLKQTSKLAESDEALVIKRFRKNEH